MLSRVFSAIPLSAVMFCGRALGWFAGRVVRPRRRYVKRTLALRLPEMTPARRTEITDGVYRELGISAVELLRHAGGRGDILEGVTIEGGVHIDAALKQGRGVLLLTAHIGNWELMGLAAPGFGYPLAYIAKTIKNKGMDRFWVRVRQKAGIRILPASNSYRECLKILRKNELLGFMLDINRPRREAVFVDFLGAKAATTPGLASLAAQSGAPVLPGFMHRVGPARHCIRVRPALAPPAGRDEAAILDATQRYTRVIEEEVLKRPEDWLWLHKRWKTRPLDEALSVS